jgi:hypothetical protein
MQPPRWPSNDVVGVARQQEEEDQHDRADRGWNDVSSGLLGPGNPRNRPSPARISVIALIALVLGPLSACGEATAGHGRSKKSDHR